MLQASIKIPNRKILQRKYAAQLPALEKLLKQLQDQVQDALKKTPLRATVTGGVKSFDSYYKSRCFGGL